MTNEEIGKQSEEYANKKLDKRVYCSCCQNPNVKQAFQAGAKWGMETICKKILEEVEKDIFIGDGTNVRLRKIIKKLGVDL